MKSVEIDKIDQLSGTKLGDNQKFYFQCHSNLSCFNKCCRNLNMFLYPYDVVRLKNRLEISSSDFIDKYVDIVLRKGNYFPDVLLKMEENKEKTCPFLTEQGCLVYTDRPDACRTFPLEHGLLFDSKGQKAKIVHFFRPPDFCMGKHEKQEWTVYSWAKDQEALVYNKMTEIWSELKALFQVSPWGNEGPNGSKAKMAFMATYNLDAFKDFIFNSSFLKRYKVKSSVLKSLQKDDADLMKFGFSWIKFYLWGIKSKKISIRK